MLVGEPAHPLAARTTIRRGLHFSRRRQPFPNNVIDDVFRLRPVLLLSNPMIRRAAAADHRHRIVREQFGNASPDESVKASPSKPNPRRPRARSATCRPRPRQFIGDLHDKIAESIAKIVPGSSLIPTCDLSPAGSSPAPVIVQALRIGSLFQNGLDSGLSNSEPQWPEAGMLHRACWRSALSRWRHDPDASRHESSSATARQPDCDVASSSCEAQN